MGMEVRGWVDKEEGVCRNFFLIVLIFLVKWEIRVLFGSKCLKKEIYCLRGKILFKL